MGILFVQPPLAEVLEPNPDVGNGRDTAVTKTAPDPALVSLIVQWRRGKSSVTVQNGCCWDKGISWHKAFRFVTGEALTASNLRGT